MAEGLDVPRFEGGERLPVVVAEIGILLRKSRNEAIDIAPRVPVPQDLIRGLGHREVPAAEQRTVSRGSAEFFLDFLVIRKADTAAVNRELERSHAGRQRVALRKDEKQGFFGQHLADPDLIPGERAALFPGFLAVRGETDVPVADPAAVIRVEHRGGVGAEETELLQLRAFKRREKPLHELTEGAAGPKIGAGPRNADEREVTRSERVSEEPVRDFLPDTGERFRGLIGIRGRDQEFARGVRDLARGGEFESREDPERGKFREERHVEGPTPQNLCRLTVGVRAGREDEVLNAREVTLNEEKLPLAVIGAVFERLNRGFGFETLLAVPAPERGGERGGDLSVVVKRHIRVASRGGRLLGKRLREGHPKRIEMVEPKRPFFRVRGGDFL